MTEAGLKVIETAKLNGSWTILDEVEEMKIPDDLVAALKLVPDAEEYFMGFSKSVRKLLLTWIVFAKQASTREKRINEIVEASSQNTKPKQFR